MSINPKVLALAQSVQAKRELDRETARQADPNWPFKIPCTKKQQSAMADMGIPFDTSAVELGGTSMGQASLLIKERSEELRAEREQERRSRPMSDQQMELLTHPDKFAVDPEALVGFTWGDASDLIQALMAPKKAASAPPVKAPAPVVAKAPKKVILKKKAKK